MRFLFVLLLAFTFTPFTSLADENRTVIDVYQEAIQKLEREYRKLKQFTTDARQKVTELEKQTNSVKTLIAKYEAALNATKQELLMKHEAQLKTITEAYQKKLAGESELAELARQSAEEDAKATRALLDKLGTSAEKVAKLTDAVTVSEDGKVGIGTTTPGAKLEVKGNIYAGNSDIYFTKTDHNHTGIGNTAGFAAIENAENYNALMILGRAGTPKGRMVRLWDYLQVNGGMDIVGNVGIGTTTPEYKLDVKGQVRTNNVTVTSDQRHKQDIHSLENALTKLQGLRGVRFKWKDNAQGTDTQIGLIAQEVEKVLPELVSTDSEGYKSIAYGKLTAVLVEAIKELQQQNEKMAQQMDAISQ